MPELLSPERLDELRKDATDPIEPAEGEIQLELLSHIDAQAKKLGDEEAFNAALLSRLAMSCLKCQELQAENSLLRECLEDFLDWGKDFADVLPEEIHITGKMERGQQALSTSASDWKVNDEDLGETS